MKVGSYFSDEYNTTALKVEMTIAATWIRRLHYIDTDNFKFSFKN